MPNAAQSIVLATRNAGKIRELEAPLRTFGLSVLGLDAFPELPEVEETGETFEANALLKARAAAEGSGLVAVADDSGLMVDALGARPACVRPGMARITRRLFPGKVRTPAISASFWMLLRRCPRSDGGRALSRSWPCANLAGRIR